LKTLQSYGTVAHWRHDRFGSWSCDNAETGSLTGLDCSATKLGEDFEHILLRRRAYLESPAFGTSELRGEVDTAARGKIERHLEIVFRDSQNSKKISAP
jgi:hypothetical protein